MANLKKGKSHKYGIFDLKRTFERSSGLKPRNGYPWPFAPWIDHPRVSVFEIYGRLDYHSLSNWQKCRVLSAVNEPVHQVEIDEYALALENDNKPVIAYFERFGRDARHIILNEYMYRCCVAYGYVDIVIDEHTGWLAWPKLEEEVIPLGFEKGSMMQNCIKLGQGVNGKWTYGVDFSVTNTGYGSGAHVDLFPFESREDCLMLALKKAEEWFYSHSTSSQANKKDLAIANFALKAVRALRDSISTPSLMQEQIFAEGIASIPKATCPAFAIPANAKAVQLSLF